MYHAARGAWHVGQRRPRRGTLAYLRTGMTAFCDSISLAVYDRAELPFTGSLAIAVSQSGGTPDVGEYLDQPGTAAPLRSP